MARRRTGAKTDEAQQDTKRSVERTADGRYLIIGGRRWRASDPRLAEAERARLVSELMSARREVGRALRVGDKTAAAAARERVHAAKVALGERGPVWWSEDAEEKA